VNSTLFIFTVISVFLTIFIESLIFILQIKGRKFSRWFGKNAFRIHMTVVGFFWVLSFILIVLLQSGKHPHFHNIIILKWSGLILLVSGLAVAIWGFMVLGIKRSFGLNFFKDNVLVVKGSAYKFVKNPEDYGLWAALAGFALFSRSSFNLAIAIEFIILMVPHMMIENIPLKKPVFFEKQDDQFLSKNAKMD